MHTTPTDTAPNKDILTQLREAKAEARLVIERVQTKALKTLEALMDEPEPTGDPKQDAFIARERNRRRMAATQALTHIRSVQREERNAAKARAKGDKQRASSHDVPLAACRPAQGPENPITPPDDSPPPGFTTIDLQQDWLRERRQAMTKARAKRKAKQRRRR
ncbi:MAG: hypothetical protein NXI14_08685 [bacterium]|nr:hypothetical protein [bacterium]